MTRHDELKGILIPFIERWVSRNRGLELSPTVIKRMASVLNCAYQRIDYNELFLKNIYPMDVQYANSFRVTWISKRADGGNDFIVCQLAAIPDDTKTFITTKSQGKLTCLVTGETLAEAFKEEFLA
jgi:hypothetical protein